MINEKMQEALNKQINAEFYSSYLYLSMAAHFESVGLKGSAVWMRFQAQEENIHAMRILDYVCERGGAVTLTAIDGPPTEWDSPLAAFEAAYGHELKVTAMINDLVDLAGELKDHATVNMLQWFVAEQVEEEASADEVVNQLKMVGDSADALLMLDQRLGQRLPPAQPGQEAEA